MKKRKHSQYRSFLLEYGFHILLLLFFVNVAIAYVFHFYVAASSNCMTTAQVKSDNRCLYIWNNQVYLPPGASRSNLHHGHQCGTDVTSVMPGNHLTDGRLLQSSPFYIANICTSNPTPTPSPTPTPTPSPTPTPTPTPTPIPTPTSSPTALPTAVPTTKPTAIPTSFPTAVPTTLPTKSIPTPTTQFISPISHLSPTATPTPTNQKLSPTASIKTALTVTPTTSLTPTNTPVPTNSLLANATISPTQGILSPTVTQILGNLSPTPTPTVSTQNPSVLAVNLSLVLPGISDGGNLNPLHPTRTASISLYLPTDNIANASVSAFSVATDMVTFDPASKNFINATYNLGNIPPGQYQLVLKLNQYLNQEIINPVDHTTVFTLSTGQPTQLPPVHLIPGDINPLPNGNNVIDVNDYNDIINCFGSKITQSSCTNKEGADLNDNGSIDGIDYNLFLIGLKQYDTINNILPTPTPTATPTAIPTPSLSPTSGIIPTTQPTYSATTSPTAPLSPTEIVQKTVSPTMPVPTTSNKQPIYKTIIAAITNNASGLTQILDFLLFGIFCFVLILGIYRSKFVQKIRRKGKKETIHPAVTEQSQQTRRQSISSPPSEIDTSFDKECYIKPGVVDQASGTMQITLINDNEHVIGMYKGTTIKEGFAQVKGIKSTDAKGVDFIQITEIVPDE